MTSRSPSAVVTCEKPQENSFIVGFCCMLLYGQSSISVIPRYSALPALCVSSSQSPAKKHDKFNIVPCILVPRVSCYDTVVAPPCHPPCSANTLNSTQGRPKQFARFGIRGGAALPRVSLHDDYRRINSSTNGTGTGAGTENDPRKDARTVPQVSARNGFRAPGARTFSRPGARNGFQETDTRAFSGTGARNSYGEIRTRTDAEPRGTDDGRRRKQETTAGRLRRAAGRPARTRTTLENIEIP